MTSQQQLLEEEPRRVIDPRNALNELTGGEWLYFTKTAITTSYPSEYSHDLRKQHGANKPPRLMKSLIEFFTKGDEFVLDPFAGVGGTLIGASIAEPPRRCVGIEISSQWIDIYEEVLEQNPELDAQEMRVGDCREIMAEYSDGHFDFIATDPPYNIHLKRTMAKGDYPEFANRQTDYNMHSTEDGDLANLPDYLAYLDAMEEVFGSSYRVLRNKRYMAVIVRNAYQNGQYMFTHVDLAQRALKVGFIPKGEKVWYQNGARLRPYGYPYAYVPNISHQFIVILRKEE
ncbi:MAG: hypothetical protein KAW89_05925 [Armatimonadetes bacterium]|nr:hypothetical protein [Armatimonadota bacterium]